MSLIDFKESTKYLNEYDNLPDSNCISYLNQLSEDDLIKILHDIKLNCSNLSKEIALYKFSLEEDEFFKDSVEAAETDIDMSNLNNLTYNEKCYLAKRKIMKLEERLKSLNSDHIQEIKELKYKLESMDLSLKNLKKEMEFFQKYVIEIHPISKKIILQKIQNYLNESIKNKRAMANRYNMQIKSFTMECNKILNQIKDQNKRLASLDEMKYQEVKYNHQKSRDALVKQRQKLVMCKNKYSTLVQTTIEMKKALEEGESKLSEISENLMKKEHMKDVMLSEKEYNDQKVKKLSKAMHKIKVDPRRHDLPEVVDYAVVKRENEDLKQSIKLWKKKVAVAEQAKLMHLKALKKKA